MDLQSASRAASKAAAQIDSRVKTRLVKRARKYGLSEAQGIDIAEAMKRAAMHTKNLPFGGERNASVRLTS